MMKKEISSTEKVRIMGVFLAKYEQNLEFILKFQNDKIAGISDAGKNSFYKFLTEFNVIWNMVKGTSDELYKDVFESNLEDVDKLADLIKSKIYSKNQRLLSLASKVLFLSDPWNIIPLDKNNKKALGIKTGSYSEFKLALEKFKKDNKNDIDELVIKTQEIAKPVTEKYSKQIKDLDKIHENRIIDKMLWVLGE